jgi:hypothetical protein
MMDDVLPRGRGEGPPNTQSAGGGAGDYRLQRPFIMDRRRGDRAGRGKGRENAGREKGRRGREIWRGSGAE